MRDEQRTPDAVRESKIYHESRRLIELERSGAEDLIGAALDGRERNVENVTRLWRLCRAAFQATLSLPLGRCSCGAYTYWEAIADYLTTTVGWTEKQLKDLRNGPLPEGSNLLDEF
jgi:hypothetical protein